MRFDEFPLLTVCFALGVVIGLALLALASEFLFGAALGIGGFLLGYVVYTLWGEKRRAANRRGAGLRP